MSNNVMANPNRNEEYPDNNFVNVSVNSNNSKNMNAMRYAAPPNSVLNNNASRNMNATLPYNRNNSNNSNNNLNLYAGIDDFPTYGPKTMSNTINNNVKRRQNLLRANKPSKESLDNAYGLRANMKLGLSKNYSRYMSPERINNMWKAYNYLGKVKNNNNLTRNLRNFNPKSNSRKLVRTNNGALRINMVPRYEMYASPSAPSASRKNRKNRKARKSRKSRKNRKN